MPRSTRSVAYVGRRSEPLPDGYIIPASTLADELAEAVAIADRKAMSARLSSSDRSLRVKGSSPAPWSGHRLARPLSPCLAQYLQAVTDRQPGEALITPPGVLVERVDRSGRSEFVAVVEDLK